MLDTAEGRSRSHSPPAGEIGAEEQTELQDGELVEDGTDQAVAMEEDEDDDLEAMMRKYKEKEIVKEKEVVKGKGEGEPRSSLSFLMDSYGGARKKRTR